MINAVPYHMFAYIILYKCGLWCLAYNHLITELGIYILPFIIIYDNIPFAIITDPNLILQIIKLLSFVYLQYIIDQSKMIL